MASEELVGNALQRCSRYMILLDWMWDGREMRRERQQFHQKKVYDITVWSWWIGEIIYQGNLVLGVVHRKLSIKDLL